MIRALCSLLVYISIRVQCSGTIAASLRDHPTLVISRHYTALCAHSTQQKIEQHTVQTQRIQHNA